MEVSIGEVFYFFLTLGVALAVLKMLSLVVFGRKPTTRWYELFSWVEPGRERAKRLFKPNYVRVARRVDYVIGFCFAIVVITFVLMLVAPSGKGDF